MSVLVYTESWDGKFKKSTFEAISYANDTAKLLGKKLVAVSLGDIDKSELNKLSSYGVNKVYSCKTINKSDSQSVVSTFEKLTNESEIIIFSNTYTAKMIAPRLCARIKAGLVSNVIELAINTSPVRVKRKSFSSKAIEEVEVTTQKTILSIVPNSYKIVECKTDMSIENINAIEKGDIIIDKKETIKNKVSLSDANIIISGGRGLKGAENWEMIEELARLLGGATACSKPVADIGWRPHAEHVGQTGKAVAPDLYIAIGISGAIQHLAGVNSSKVIVVINTDAEAPFFKSADYGIIGDAFEVVPKMIEEIKLLNNLS